MIRIGLGDIKTKVSWRFTILNQIDRYFWILLVLGITLGFLFPQFFMGFESLIIYIVMAIAGILFLKVDILDIITHIKQPFFMLYIAFINLIITPIATFYIFGYFVPKLAPALLLIAALPSGVSSGAFTDMMKGKTSLTTTIIVLTNLLSVVTIPALFLLLNNTQLDIDVYELGLNILKILGIPFVIATIIRKLIPSKITDSIQNIYNLTIVLLLTSMMTITFSFQSEYILTHFSALLKPLAILFLAFGFFQLIGYFSIFWHNKSDKIAVSNSNMIVNTVLGVVLALGHFPNEVVSMMILALIPWNLMIIAKNWYRRLLP